MSSETPPAESPDTIEIDPADALRRMRAGATLLDVRDDDERASGMPERAIGISRASLEARVAQLAITQSAELLAICATGQRSLLARNQLLELGYSRVFSVRGGFSRWCAEGLPTNAGSMDADSAERYSRHLLLPEVGVSGQLKLASARVALVGAGGLGSPAALYLAAAGVGNLTLIDDDRVERSNLQRQVIHTEARIGMPKTASASLTLAALNPSVRIFTHEQRLVAGNVEALLSGHDLIIDGADNFPTRYLLDAASRNLGIPLIYGAVHRFTGQVSVFDPRKESSPCYRCLFPEPPSAEEAPNCSEAGVLGVLPGIIGLLQCSEAIKLIIGQGRPLVGRLLCFDALNASFRELSLVRDPDCPGCKAGSGLSAYEEIATLCAG
ncbi:molybdopterin-synthase adenylyltransferase MoeB [Dokdonella sp.]|uniref:molybdopterin-synthase adenylyltransferase MoeB n=1 Tax=Dokdonella sp. TaxID=2291710 RepID=UPI003C3E4C78